MFFKTRKLSVEIRASHFTLTWSSNLKSFVAIVRVLYKVLQKYSKIYLSSHKNEKPLKATYTWDVAEPHFEKVE